MVVTNSTTGNIKTTLGLFCYFDLINMTNELLEFNRKKFTPTNITFELDRNMDEFDQNKKIKIKIIKTTNPNVFVK